jgi:hypothetical protein
LVKFLVAYKTPLTHLRKSEDDEKIANVSAMIETMPGPVREQEARVRQKRRSRRSKRSKQIMINEYVRMALSSIKGAKFRSALTMFGIVIGVSSVVTIVSVWAKV